MAKSADISTKRLISLAPENWVKWVTQIPDIVAGEVLNSEFQWISGAEESTIQQALQILRANEQLSQLETVLAFFATFVLDSALVQEIMRWDMAVLRESPWYQQILREGEARGRQEEILSGIELGLEIKFGTEGLQLMPEICQVASLQFKIKNSKFKIKDN